MSKEVAIPGLGELESVTHVEDRSDHDMDRLRIHFQNGYGVSVIRGEYSYGGPEGLYEVAVLRDDRITYDTLITDDTIGWLTEQGVIEVAQRVASL